MILGCDRLTEKVTSGRRRVQFLAEKVISNDLADKRKTLKVYSFNLYYGDLEPSESA